MQNLDIILEGAMLGTELEVLTEGTSNKYFNAVSSFSKGLKDQAQRYFHVLTDVAKKAKDTDVATAAAKGKEAITNAMNQSVAQFKSSVSSASEGFKKAQKASMLNITKFKSSVSDNVTKAYASSIAKINAIVKGNPETKDKLKDKKFKKGDGKSEGSLNEISSEAKSEEKKAANSESVIGKAIDSIRARMKATYESFKDELSNPSWKGISIAAVGAIASYGVLYGVLKSFKLEGIGSVINPVANIKLAIKVATTPSVYGAGKTALIVAILTILVGAIGVTGTMVFNLIKSKFKK